MRPAKTSTVRLPIDNTWFETDSGSPIDRSVGIKLTFFQHAEWVASSKRAEIRDYSLVSVFGPLIKDHEKDNRMAVQVKVSIASNDRYVGAMVKALAFEVSGPSAVKGATKQFLDEHGSYVFSFPNSDQADSFRQCVERYLPGLFAKVT